MITMVQRLLLLAWLLPAWLLLQAAPALALPALWQVTNGKGGTLTVFGTIHVLPTRVLIGETPPDPDWLSPKARAAFDAADTLIVEIAPGDDPTARLQTFQKLATLAKPVPVAARLPANLRPQFNAMATMGNLPVAQLARFKNWAVSLVLVQSQAVQAGLDAGSGADVTLMGFARQSGKRVIGLETPGFQLQLFNNLSVAEQREILITTVRDAERSSRLMNDMVAAWQAGNMEKLADAFGEGELSADAQKRLLRDRNANWATQVARLLSGNQRLFMAVGAGHMTGPDSLILMLEARGLKVQRLE
jgi:uncharacterized protein